MTIAEMIDRYGLIPCGDKLQITKNKAEASQNLDSIRAKKLEILQWFEAEAERKTREEAQKQANFEAIPGMSEIMDSRREWAALASDLRKATDEGTGILPAKPKTDPEALEAKYPMAMWALKVKREALESQNYEIASIAEKAYDAIRAGGDLEEIKAAYDTDIHALTQRHIWD